MDHQRKKVVFYPGEIVFAKMKNFPHWPARILDSRLAPPSPPNKIAVAFYGTNELGFIRHQDLFDYSEFLSVFGVEKKVKGFNEGLAEAGADFRASANLSASVYDDGDLTVSSAATSALSAASKKWTAKKDVKILNVKKLRLASLKPTLPMSAAESERQSIIDELQQVQRQISAVDASVAVDSTSSAADSSKRVRKPKVFEDFFETPAAPKRAARQSVEKIPKLKLTLPTAVSTVASSSSEQSSEQETLESRRKSSCQQQQQHQPSPLGEQDDDATMWMKIKSEFPETFSDATVSLERPVEENTTRVDSDYEYESSIWSEHLDPDANKPLSNIVKRENESADYDIRKSVVPPATDRNQQRSLDAVLPEKRIRKKKTFSDDFVSPDVIIGGMAGQKHSTKKPATPSASTTSSTASRIVYPPTLNPDSADDDDDSGDDQRSESDISRRLVIDESFRTPASSVVSTPVRAVQYEPSPPVAKVAPLKIRFGPFSSASALTLAKRKKKEDASSSATESPKTPVVAKTEENFDAPPPSLSYPAYENSSRPMSALLRSPPHNATSVATFDNSKIKKKQALKIRLLGQRGDRLLSSATTGSSSKAVKKSSKKMKTQKTVLGKPKLGKRKYTKRKDKTATSGKILRQDGESEENFRIRRRIANRTAKQNRKLRKLFVTAYSYWMSVEMERMLKEQPTLTDFQEIRFTLQSKWRLLPSQEKEKYRILAKHERERRMINASLDKLGDKSGEQDSGEKSDNDSEEPSSSSTKANVDGEMFSVKMSKDSAAKKRILKQITDKKASKKIKKEEASPLPYVDPDTFAVLSSRGLVGPMEARSRWWLYSSAPSTPGRRRVNRENSPPRPLTSDIVDASAIFRLMSKTFEQMGNRLMKGHENTTGAVGAFVDTLLDGFFISVVHLMGAVKHIHPNLSSKSNHGNDPFNASNLVEKTAYLTPM